MNTSDEIPTPFAGGALRDERDAASTVQDPYQALDQLMVVAEALCPVWPHRAPFSGTERMLL